MKEFRLVASEGFTMAEASALKLQKEDITKMVRGMDRPALMKALSLTFDWPVIGDVQDLYPLSLFAKSARKIQQWNVPFLNRGAPAKCCDGAKLCRFGHKTVAVKCYATALTSGATVCAH